jgi:hypothetical protein
VSVGSVAMSVLIIGYDFAFLGMFSVYPVGFMNNLKTRGDGLSNFSKFSL